MQIGEKCSDEAQDEGAVSAARPAGQGHVRHRFAGKPPAARFNSYFCPICFIF